MKEMIDDLQAAIDWLTGLEIEAGEDVGIRNKVVAGLQKLKDGIAGPLQTPPEEMRQKLGTLYANMLLGAVNKWLGGKDPETAPDRFRLEKFIQVTDIYDLEKPADLIKATGQLKGMISVDSAADFAHCLFESMQENRVMPIGFHPPWLNLTGDGKTDPALWLVNQIFEFRKIYLEEQAKKKKDEN